METILYHRLPLLSEPLISIANQHGPSSGVEYVRENSLAVKQNNLLIDRPKISAIEAKNSKYIQE
ncbi:MAG: hypothetical protein IPO25_23025 [Saprospiraceae bacterium]|nr:hypothetical protein [Saprospiraceae bacterium]